MTNIKDSLPLTWDSNDRLLTLLDCIRFSVYPAIVYKIEWLAYCFEIPKMPCVHFVIPYYLNAGSKKAACHSCAPTVLERIRPIPIEEMLTHECDLVREKVKAVLEEYPWLLEDDTHHRKLEVFSS